MIEKLKKQNWTFTLIGTDNLDVKTMAVLCRGKATKGRAPQMVRTAIRNQVFNLSDLIIAPVLYKTGYKITQFSGEKCQNNTSSLQS